MSSQRLLSGLPYRAASSPASLLSRCSRPAQSISRHQNAHTITQPVGRFPQSRLTACRPYSSSSASSSQPVQKSKLPKRAALAALLLATLYATSDLTGLTDSAASRPLNLSTFAPFTITSKEQVSPTAFVLTVRPSSLVDPSGLASLLPTTAGRHASEEVIAAAWATGRTWSVEIKQPQLQVAREYTPLPSTPSSTTSAGELKFLIRRLDRGEVSTYLANLSVGDRVELRGPHLGLDVAGRLLGHKGGLDQDRERRVVFLAGGTGIAPALQVARAVAMMRDHGRTEAPRVEIVWANRSRADCPGCPGLGSAGELGQGAEAAGGGGGPVVEQLAELQRRYPGRVTVRCAVDEEGSFIDAGVVARAAGLALPAASSPSPISFFFGRKTAAAEEAKTHVGRAECWVHDQDRVALRPATETETDACSCAGDGKNLLFVSGPDGFVEAYAGAKRWAGGMELQGPLGGLVGELGRRDPAFGRDWLVLKL